MPFGVKNGPVTFQCVMNEVFDDLYGDCVLVYLDDILIFLEDEEAHVHDLQTVLTQL